MLIVGPVGTVGIDSFCGVPAAVSVAEKHAALIEIS
jgi:hypothetical protein